MIILNGSLTLKSSEKKELEINALLNWNANARNSLRKDLISPEKTFETLFSSSAPLIPLEGSWKSRLKSLNDD